MCGVDYDGWADYVEQLLNHFAKRPRSLVDLACGTGSSTLPFAKRGYQVAGVDLSAAMLSQARLKAKRGNLDITFYQSDLCLLELPEKFDLAVLFQDGLNYILCEQQLERALLKIFDLLNPGALFIFDLTLPHLRFDNNNSSLCWVDEDDFSLIWETDYCTSTNLWSVLLTVFHRTENGFFEKFQERHQEKNYEPELVKELLKKTGFALLGLYPTFNLEPTNGSEQKLTFVAEKGQDPGPY
ncbi:MAG: class I SAM-dependent DNA methyltransferase [Bacillota bacterium]